MRIILDENLWPEAAVVLNAFEARYGLTFVHINDIAPGVPDDDIPNICKQHDAAALVSANVKDFGARRVIFEALLTAGVSVIVPRPSRRVALTPQVQIAILVKHIEYITKALKAAQGQILLKVTEGGATEISLAQLMRETR